MDVFLAGYMYVSHSSFDQLLASLFFGHAGRSRGSVSVQCAVVMWVCTSVLHIRLSEGNHDFKKKTIEERIKKTTPCFTEIPENERDTIICCVDSCTEAGHCRIVLLQAKSV